MSKFFIKQLDKYWPEIHIRSRPVVWLSSRPRWQKVIKTTKTTWTLDKLSLTLPEKKNLFLNFLMSPAILITWHPFGTFRKHWNWFNIPIAQGSLLSMPPKCIKYIMYTLYQGEIIALICNTIIPATEWRSNVLPLPEGLQIALIHH